MKLFKVILLLFITGIVHGQSDSVLLKETVVKLDKAMTGKDYGALQELLHKDVSFGHSTGWIQTKTDVLNDLKSGKLHYAKMDRTGVYVAAMNDGWALVRSNAQAEGVTEGKPFSVRLHVLHVWIKDGTGQWQLVARQATKLP